MFSRRKKHSSSVGRSRGIVPVAAAKATRPEPAGKEIPSLGSLSDRLTNAGKASEAASKAPDGNRVCESPPVPTSEVKSAPKPEPLG